MPTTFTDYKMIQTNSELQDLQSRAQRLAFDNGAEGRPQFWDEFASNPNNLPKKKWYSGAAFNGLAYGALAGIGTAAALAVGAGTGADSSGYFLPLGVGGAGLGLVLGGTGAFGPSKEDTRGMLVEGYKQYLDQYEQQAQTYRHQAPDHGQLTAPSTPQTGLTGLPTPSSMHLLFR
jgi:hypothetical protein